jgi:hypothetical protein
MNPAAVKLLGQFPIQIRGTGNFPAEVVNFTKIEIILEAALLWIPGRDGSCRTGLLHDVAITTSICTRLTIRCIEGFAGDSGDIPVIQMAFLVVPSKRMSQEC